MSTSQDAYHGRTPGIMDQLVRLKQSEFLSFSRYHLQIPEKTIQTAMKYAELSDDAKYEMVQDCYRQDRIEFVQRHSPHVHSLITNIQPNRSLPDYLPAKCVYDLIDDQKSTGTSWKRYAREELMVEFDKIWVDLSEKVLSVEQKYSLLHRWGRNGAPEDRLEEELTRRYEQYRGCRAF